MDVTVSQCTYPFGSLKRWWCGICDRLVASPRVHLGGYGQAFCGHVFCCSCVDAVAASPLASYRRGKNNEKIFICPSGDCLQSFQHPYFVPLCPIMVEVYMSISIECLKCRSRFNPYAYAIHRLRCKVVSQAMLPTTIANRMDSIPPVSVSKKVQFLINYEKKWLLRSLNFGSLVDDQVSLSQLSDGSDIIIERPGTLEPIIVKKISNSEDLLASVASKVSMEVGSIDLVCFIHRSLTQCRSFEEFAVCLPPGAPIALVEKRDNLINLDCQGLLLYLYSSLCKSSDDAEEKASTSKDAQFVKAD